MSTPAQVFERKIVTGLDADDRAREERVVVTGWADGSVGIRVEHRAEDTWTTTYADQGRALEIHDAIGDAMSAAERAAS